MNTILKLCAGICPVIGLSMAAIAVETDTQGNMRSGDNASTAVSTQAQLVRYIPPSGSRPTPKTRVGKGCSRGVPGAASTTVTLLVPEHVAYTSQEQPTLYWHLSSTAPQSVVVTVTGLDDVQPLIEKALTGPHAAGIHYFRLRDYGARLTAGKIYRCSVQVVEKLGEPSVSDPLATAFVERKTGNKDIAQAGQHNSTLDRAQRYAGSGLWLDALDALFGSEGSEGSDATLMQARKALLEQVGLQGLAAQAVAPH